MDTVWLVLIGAALYALTFGAITAELRGINRESKRIADSLGDLLLRLDSMEGVLERGLPDVTPDDDF